MLLNNLHKLWIQHRVVCLGILIWAGVLVLWALLIRFISSPPKSPVAPSLQVNCVQLSEEEVIALERYRNRKRAYNRLSPDEKAIINSR